MEHWHKQRIKQKILQKVIYNDVPESRERIKKGPSLKFAQIKFLPIKNISLTGTIIYNNKVILTIWDLQTPLAISIESEEISKTYRDDFRVLWKTAIK